MATLIFGLNIALAGDVKTLSVEDVKAMPASRGGYRSINNWKTVETTSSTGVSVCGLLERCGVTGDGASVKISAPDGYFWPALGDTLTVKELKKKGIGELLPLIAYEMSGKALDPEPDGTGPLRYVAPQYSIDDTNKPSWVSNVRLIEVGPPDKEAKPPDAKKIPAGEVWVYGNIPLVYPMSMILPLAFGAAGLAVLLMSLIIVIASRSSRRHLRSAVSALLAACLLAGGMGETMRIANEKQAYAITDRATFIVMNEWLSLKKLVEGDGRLINQYTVTVVNPERFSDLNHQGAVRFKEFLLSGETKELIRKYGWGRYHQRLFYPD